MYGLWVTLEAAAIGDVAAGLGFDWIGIDAASGHLDWQVVQEHVRATARSETVALVRVADATPAVFRRALQLGADGILLPCPEDATQLHSLLQQVGHESDKGEQPLIGLTIDQSGSIPNLSELIRIDGVDFFFLESIGVEKNSAAIDQSLAGIRSAGKHAGIVAANDQELSQYLAHHFTILGVGSDAAIIRRGMEQTMTALGRR